MKSRTKSKSKAAAAEATFESVDCGNLLLQNAASCSNPLRKKLTKIAGKLWLSILGKSDAKTAAASTHYYENVGFGSNAAMVNRSSFARGHSVTSFRTRAFSLEPSDKTTCEIRNDEEIHSKTDAAIASMEKAIQCMDKVLREDAKNNNNNNNVLQYDVISVQPPPPERPPPPKPAAAAAAKRKPPKPLPRSSSFRCHHQARSTRCFNSSSATKTVPQTARFSFCGLTTRASSAPPPLRSPPPLSRSSTAEFLFRDVAANKSRRNSR